ncbi:hypothetical protein E7744_09755 [Citricoccus sp. SGAir0253]|uniref:hypothetical protein n=1 Tax=Citricoccus sp. SGAir0253 TaxID=2567881 RepID=UPI0010CCB4A0|nr:hypothetical protein [Citricoccus sp. SGAir0253]QCU78410.1 hypothetical protein E7744_09755 [Citricoccus sp. SGAir0253]
MPSPASSDPSPGRPHAPGRLVTPGLVDQHCHGHAGVDFATASPAAVRAAVAGLAARGVTRVVASVPTMPAAELLDAVHRLAPLVWEGVLAGIHLEGPFLSPRRCGAQSPADVLRPDAPGAPGLVRALLAAGAGRAAPAGVGAGPREDAPPGSPDGANAIIAMTYAPELPGADRLEAALLAAGVLPSPGHTDATAEEFVAALERLADRPGGAPDGREDSRPGGRHRGGPEDPQQGRDERHDGGRVPAVTHLFNAMAGFHHRRPGPVPAALAAAAAGRLRLELIADGHHVDPAVVRDVVRLVPGAVCVVSDASAATEAPPGRYRLGAVALERAAGSAAPTLAPAAVPAGTPPGRGSAAAADPSGTPAARRPAGPAGATLASGAVALDRSLALLVEWGVPWETAVRTVTTTPARGLPPSRRPSGWVVWDAPGRAADVVLPQRPAPRPRGAGPARPLPPDAAPGR